MATGVATAATESDILQFAQRFAGVGTAMGLSAAQIVGWSAAVLSAGVKTQAGQTAMQRTFVDMNSAISANGKELKGWAAITGQTAEQFKAAFDKNANDQLLRIVESLAHMAATGKDVLGPLSAVGITEARQVNTLLLLARAQEQNANANLKASNILDVANKGYEDTARYQEAVRQRSQTLAAQLTILRNQIFVLGTTFGNSLLGPLTRVVHVFQALAAGVSVIPGPVRAIVLIVGGLITVLMAAAAAMILLGARVLIAYSAMKQLQAGAFGASGGLNAVNAAQERGAAVGGEFNIITANAARTLREQQQAALGAAAAIGFMSGSTESAATMVAKYNGAVQAAQTGTNRLGTWIGRLGKFASYATIAMVGLSVYTGLLGEKQVKANAAAEKAAGEQKDLVAAFRQSGQAGLDSANNWIKTQPAYDKARIAAGRLGIAEARLMQIISGNASMQDFNDIMNLITEAQKKGVGGTDDLVRGLAVLRGNWK